ncbi:Inner membrane protein YhaH [Brevundimonas sp. SH203]|uniref:DUF805 domain-containing protein n=1 Tax=Brevundimonas sp. SH203 TaxID=345167 RepID=UPI0009CBFFB2|nr:DUF805 domain-containing protein [Brevundimonas sp. SH203]GAW41253.1 Inner membrane protein YhaH [Brevundimonas sp. SH203]
MRGEILSYDPATGDGLISGDDLQRYAFTSAAAGLEPGRRVDFVVQDDQALSLMVLRDGPLPPAVYPPEPDLGLWGYFVRCITDLYIEGHGRARRKEYWSFALFHFLILMLAFMPIIGLAVLEAEAGYDMEVWGVAWICIVALVYFALIVPYVCVTIRRFHDVGLSGWLILIGLVPYVGGLFTFIVSLLPSQPAVNVHGAPPKGLGALQYRQVSPA